MNYSIDWTFSAINSYEEEIDFIFLKWNHNEVLKFEKLVEIELERLSKNPTLGVLRLENIFSLILSKQTTLFYKIKNDDFSIELLLFWNNQKNPSHLNKLL